MDEVLSPSAMENPHLSKEDKDQNNGDCGGGVSCGVDRISTVDSINHSNQSLQFTPSNTDPSPLSKKPSETTRSIVNSTNCGRIIKKNKRVLKEGSSSSASSSSPTQQRGGLHIMSKRRTPKVLLGGRRSESDFDALALPLGMSFAAVVAQVLDSKTIADERISADHLSMVFFFTLFQAKMDCGSLCLTNEELVINFSWWVVIQEVLYPDRYRLVLSEAEAPPFVAICTSAVKESLANVFGDRFDCFVRNFEKSFGSTLRTLRMINKASIDKGIDPTGHSSIEDYSSDVPHSTSNEQGHTLSESSTTNCHSEVVRPTCGLRDPLAFVEEMKEAFRPGSVNQELILHGQINQQLASISRSTSGSGFNRPMMSTFEKSLVEHARSNDLKTFEIGLIMKKLQLKESQLALNSDSNHLERCKLSMGVSKASFKAEKFKTQLEDTRHGELLKKCIDCLVAGLFIMSSSLLYGAYIYSYQRITEATSSCLSPPKESNSWFIPKSVSSFNSGLHSLRCHFEIISRMLFGVLMILSIGYLLLQRSSATNQTMPVTLILLLLGGVCGFAGKFCVDTLGGNGYLWLLYWEVLCMLHFFANIFTSALFFILYGSLSVTQGAGAKANSKLPFWIRRFVFYAVTVLLLPLLCGLMPFAGLGDWKDHFSSLVLDALIWERS